MSLRALAPLPAADFAEVRRRAIFDCCKWDAQVGDASVLAPYALELDDAAWTRLAHEAQALAAETLAAERELCARPELMRRLGVPWRLRRQLARPGADPVRVMRFDFHLTTGGWRISEANTDVPGGYSEASGFTTLVAAHHPGLEPTGDPAAALVAALQRRTRPDAHVAFVHATAYTDDRQVMLYLARRLEAQGGAATLCSPAQLEWQSDGVARSPGGARLDAVVRFFPCEWLPALPRGSGWRWFFGGARTPLTNPASARLTQTKRFPLVWDDLATPLPTWRALLPETREVGGGRGHHPDWVLKPAFGRVGEDIALPGVTGLGEWDAILRRARRHPADWVAQRRFEIVPVETAEGPRFPCLGVYTVDGVAAGIYGRLGVTPLVDARAADVAVLRRG